MFTKKEVIIDLYVWQSKLKMVSLIIFMFLSFIAYNAMSYITVLHPKENFHYLKEVGRNNFIIVSNIIAYLIGRYNEKKEEKKIEQIEKEEGAIKNDMN